MITLTERKEIIARLREKRKIPLECSGPGESKTQRFVFEALPGQKRIFDGVLLEEIEVVYCPPLTRMPGNICNSCVVFRAPEVYTGIPIGKIKRAAGI